MAQFFKWGEQDPADRFHHARLWDVQETARLARAHESEIASWTFEVNCHTLIRAMSKGALSKIALAARCSDE